MEMQRYGIDPFSISKDSDLAAHVLAYEMALAPEAYQAPKRDNVPYHVLPFNESLDGEDTNYSPYHLYALTSRIVPEIVQYNKAMYPKLDVDQIDERLHVILRLKNGTKSVPITSEAKRIIDWSMEPERVNMTTILTTKYSIMHKGVCLDKEWIAVMLPHVKVKDAVMEGEHLMIDLSNVNMSYKLYKERVYQEILDNLLYLHKKGAISCSENSSIIRDWELREVNGVYYPTWNNNWVTVNRSRFLMSRLEGITTVSYPLAQTYQKKHTIAIALSKEGYEFQFNGKSVSIKVDNYKEAIRVHSIVVSAVVNTEGEVFIDMTPPEDGYRDKAVYRDLGKGLVVSWRI